MKIKNLIILILLLSVSNAYSQCGYAPNSHFKPRQFGFYAASTQGPRCAPNPHFRPRQYVVYVPCPQTCCLNCNCTDPGCMNYNCCMDCEKCCAAFGNVGAGDYEPLGHPWMPARPCGERYIPRADRIPNGGGSIAKLSDRVKVVNVALKDQLRPPMLHKVLKQHVTRTFPICKHYVMKKQPKVVIRPASPAAKHYVLRRPIACPPPHVIKPKRDSV